MKRNLFRVALFLLLPASVHAASFALSVDRPNYLVGEAPTYSISGAAPNQPILWSSWLNGSSTGENNANYGQTTNSSGNWSSPGGVWAAANVGFWTKQVLIGGTTAQINFYVSPSLASLTPGPATPATQMLGIDAWDGIYASTPPYFHLSSDPLPVEQAKLIQNLNGQTILLPFGFPIANDFPGTVFSTNPINNLTDLAKTPIFQQIFSMSFSTYVLTAFTYSNQNYLSQPNPTAEQQEIANLTAYLLQTYQGTGKTFIIKNWEGDWAMSEAANNGTPVRPYTFSPILLQTMTDWLNARHAGVVQGRTQAGAVSRVSVHDAAEFVWLTEGLKNLPGMLTSVIPNVQSEYIAYSSYDTINGPATGNLRRSILDAITYLRHSPSLNGRPLLIGEFGFSLDDFADADARATAASQAFMDASIPLASYWVLADHALTGSPANPAFGLVTPSNTRTVVWNAFRTLLAPQNNAVFVSSSVPNVMVAGSTYTISIQMQNMGTVPWNPVNTYQLMSQNPASNIVWGSSQAVLASSDSIAPSATKTFQFNVTAPTAPGHYTMQWQMTQQVVGPFGPVVGIPITVNPPLPKPVSATLKSQYDVIIVGAGAGGVSAAIQAARLGAKVALLEQTDWIGGQMTAAGVTSMDEAPGANYPDRQNGLYKEFITQVQNYYAALGKSVNTPYHDAAHIAFEPSVGEGLLYQMVSATPNLDLSLYTRVTGVQKSGNIVTGISATIITPGAGLTTQTISAKVVIDATEYGDLLPLAGARYRSGNATSDALSENAQIQDLTYTAVMKRYPAGVPPALQTTAPSSNYTTFKTIFSAITINGGNTTVPATYPVDWPFQNAYRGMPDSSNPVSYTSVQTDLISKTQINWANDYPGNQYANIRWNGYLTNQYLEDPVYRQQINCQAKIMTLDFVYYVQHDLGHTDWALADDEGYNTPYNIQQNSCGALMPPAYQPLEPYLPVMPYTRESRRLIGLHTMTASELSRTGPAQYDTLMPTAIVHSTSAVAIGDYPADVHAQVIDPVLESSLETAAQYANADINGQFQVPFEAFIPETVDGFIAAEKNISVSRIVNGAIREQPIAMLTGQAAGAIAAIAVQKGLQPRNLNPVWVQSALINAQSTLSLYRFSDVSQLSPFWPAVELVSTHEIMHGINASQFDLTDALTRDQLAIVTAKLLQLSTTSLPSTQTFADEPPSDIGYPSVEALYLDGAVLGAVPGGNFLPNNNSTRADVATFVASAMHLNLNAIPTTPYFTDVPSSHPAFKYIQALAQQNMLNSCGGTNFCPGATESRGQAVQDLATILQNATMTQLLAPINQPPFVSAGSSQTITLPNFATLQGTATDDGLPYGILNTTWSVISASGPMIFSSTYTPVTHAIFSSTGTYVLRLTATDGALVASSSVTITVINPPAPTANAQAVTTAFNTATAITLTGTDPNGLSLTYAVSVGPTHGALMGTIPNLTYTPTGGYLGMDSFNFTVNNGFVTSVAATIAVTVNPLPTVATPIISPNGGTYTNSVSVMLVCITPGAQIYYSVDGSTPTQSSTFYTAPFTLTANATVRAKAFAADMNPSAEPAAAVFIVNPLTQPTTITQPPANQTVYVGQSAVFSVNVTGAAPLTYQWFKNGTAIGGAIDASYTMPGTVLADNGTQFTVMVNNAIHAPVTSSIATLTVNPLPQPQLNLPSEILITGNISIQYPYPAGHFGWIFTSVNASAQALDTSAIVRNATAAGITTASPKLDLSPQNLQAGPYILTFEVFDLNNNLAASASASVALVEGNFSSAKVFPNPFRAARGDSTVTFALLPGGSTIKIFTVSGRTVRTLDGSAGSASWDLNNDAGEHVASGLYLYIISDTQGDKIRGKLGVIR